MDEPPLSARAQAACAVGGTRRLRRGAAAASAQPGAHARAARTLDPPCRGRFGVGSRSEEHTSELQSLMRISYAVFCLKNKKRTMTKTDNMSVTHDENTAQKQN